MLAHCSKYSCSNLLIEKYEKSEKLMKKYYVYVSKFGIFLILERSAVL